MFLPLSAHLLLIMLRCLGTDGQASLPPPTMLRASSPSPTSILLTWEQLEGADAVDRYEIYYRYTVNECANEGSTFRPVNFTVNIGSLRNYTVTNSTLTPVEEDGRYVISLTAINNVTRSATTGPVTINTADAAPGMPQSLRIGSVDVTNITILWDRVNCIDRNGAVSGYTVINYPTSDPSDRRAPLISGTAESDRMFSVTGLPPRTNYTFEVDAIIRFVPDGARAIITVSTTPPQDIGFLLRGRIYSNNSVVTQADIGDSFFGVPLYCLSPRQDCCSSSQLSGEWYLPDGTAVSSSTTPFSRTQVPSAVSLYRETNSPPTGVFRCEIPDASGNSQNIYVGIYPEGVGSPSITSVVLDRNSITLTCTTTGGPPTTVTWKKNNNVIQFNSSIYDQSKQLVSSTAATYRNILSSRDISNFVGTFTCEVSNARGAVRDTTELNGVSVIRDQFSVGGIATARCISDAQAIRMEWLNNGVIVASDTNTRELNLTFSPVNDSIHNLVYVCRVTRNGEEGTLIMAVQNFTVTVAVPPTVLNATVSSSGIARAGMIYNLTCTVSKTVDGLINSPTAVWTDLLTSTTVSNGNGITVTMMATEVVAIATLTFDPLRTSHDGTYSCDGTLTSPALNTALMPSTVETLHVQISTPTIDVIIPAGRLFAGSTTPFTLTCTITINPATDTDVSITEMDVTWLNGTSPLSSSDSRVTISPVSGSRLSPFTSTLTLDPLSTFDNTTFICQARARPPANQQSFIVSSLMGYKTASIAVSNPIPPTVSIGNSSSSVMAGQPFNLTCSVLVQEGIGGTPSLAWSRVSDGMELSFNESSDSLSFPSILVRDVGRYTCSARLTLPEAGVDVFGASTVSVFVQVPPPNVTVGSREDGLCGKTLALNCFINRALYGIDTEPIFSWSAPDGSLVSTRESANPRIDTQSRQLYFNDISTANGGSYTCQVAVSTDNTARTSITVDTNVPGAPKNLKCGNSGVSPSELLVYWDYLSGLEGDVVRYVVDVKELQHKNGTREVIQSNVANFTTEMRSTNIQQLAPKIPYNITVKALNLAGCGEETQVYCFTQEGEPPVPENLTVVETNTTSIKVCWKRFTLVELEGLANYSVAYRPAGAPSQDATTIIISWKENCSIIRDLASGVEYNITVSISLSRRSSIPMWTRATTRFVAGTPDNNSLPIIIGIVVPVAVVLALICAVLVGVCVVRKKRHSDEVKLEKSRMLRAFEEPIMLKSKDMQSTDNDNKKTEEEAIASSEPQAEKPSATSGGDCELVESPVHVPSTFTASKAPAMSCDVVSNGDGPS